MITGLTPSTFTKLQLNAGVLIANFDHSNIADKSALATAIAAKVGQAGWLGATRGGGEFSATPETREIEADGMRSAFVGSTILDGWEVSLKADLLEMTPENLKYALGSADVVTASSKTTITLRNEYDEDDYIDSVCWIGDLSDGGFVLIEIENALAVGGLTLSFEDKGEGTIPLELTAHQSSVDGQTKAPCKIVYFN